MARTKDLRRGDLGDNRDACSDSRYWETVPLELVRGKVIVVFGRNGIRRLK